MVEIKAIAIDYEPLALEVLKLHCDKIKSLKLMRVFTSAIDAIEFLKHQTVDLVFLDINMPEVSGLGFRSLIHQKLQIIFVTAYEQHALESYDLDATDYLLKPVSFERLYKAVERSRERKSEGENQNNVEENLSVFVKGDKTVFQISIKEIDYVEGLKDYARIHYRNTESVVIRESLKNIMEHLEPHGFIRTHRSFIVALSKITKMRGNLLEVANVEIPLSKPRREQLLTHFKKAGILGDRSE